MEDSGPSKPKWYRQSFCKSWLVESEFSEWLTQTTDGQPTCKFCDFTFKDANKGGLQRHMKTDKHIKARASKKSSLSMTAFFKPRDNEKEAADELERGTAKAELLMTGHMAEHRVPFRRADHMCELFAAMFPDSKIAANMKSKRTKASYVMQDGIAYSEKKSLSSICSKNPFSLLIDESTDISVSQVLAVVVRCIQDNEVKDLLLDVVEVENGSAETLYAAVKGLFTAKNIPMQNIIGFAADNCATMMGKNSGFQRLLKSDVPSVFVIGCVCHSFALCASHASHTLPSWLESFIKDLCSYFSRSAKRQRDFDLIQKVVKAQEHKMLKLCQTRWLSRGQVVARIIEQWDALLLYFQTEASIDKVDGASSIYKVLSNAGTKHMMLFLNYILPKVDRMNLHFQSEEPRIHTLFTNISSLYKDLLSLFVQDEVLVSRDLNDVDPTDESIHRPLDSIVVGGRCTSELARVPLGDNEERFRTDCKRFLEELCKQIHNRFDFSTTSVLASLCILDPVQALSTPRPLQTLIHLALHFPQIIANEELDNLDDEWRTLPNDKAQLQPLQNKSVPEFWTLIKSLKDGTGQYKYPTLGRFMCALAVLPHSSACVERVFSEVNMVKTSVTNRLHAETLANRLLARQHLTRQKQTCCTWSPDEDLVNVVKNGICYRRYLERTKASTRDKDLYGYDIHDDLDDDHQDKE